MGRYTYRIGDRELTRADFVKRLSEDYFADCAPCGRFALAVANYKAGERETAKMERVARKQGTAYSIYIDMPSLSVTYQE